MSDNDTSPGYPACWCIHYRVPGTSKRCGAGVKVDAFDWAGYDAVPCFLNERGESKQSALKCAHLRRPTPEEIEAHKSWIVTVWIRRKMHRVRESLPRVRVNR